MEKKSNLKIFFVFTFILSVIYQQGSFEVNIRSFNATVENNYKHNKELKSFDNENFVTLLIENKVYVFRFRNTYDNCFALLITKYIICEKDGQNILKYRSKKICHIKFNLNNKFIEIKIENNSLYIKRNNDQYFIISTFQFGNQNLHINSNTSAYESGFQQNNILTETSSEYIYCSNTSCHFRNLTKTE